MELTAPPSHRTVSFLFTDIEDSTRLWEHHPEAMNPDLARHDALLHQIIQAHGGHVFKTIGDAFCAAFATPLAAVQAATEAQQALLQEVPRLRVRMAVHTGEAVARDNDYFGPALNRVARLLIAGHGGQLLLSQATAEQLQDGLPEDAHLQSMGEHRLRDLASKERIYQLQLPGLPSHFPPLNTLDVAFRQGLLRAAAIAAVVLTVITGLSIATLLQTRRADRVAREAARQRQLAQEGQRKFYAARINLAQQTEQAGDTARALQVLEALRPGAGHEDRRGFEWRYLWARCQDTARTVLQGHTGGITAVAFSPDGRLAASAGEDAVRLWDVRSQLQTAAFPNQSAIYWDVAFSPDGRLLAASSADRTVKLYDVASCRMLATLRGHRGAVGPLAFSADGRTLASGSQDGTVKLWDLASRREVGSLSGFTGFLSNVQFTGFLNLAISPDSRTLAIGQADGRVLLWDLASRRRVKLLAGPPGPIYAMAFSPNGKLLTFSAGDQTIRLWSSGAGWGAQGSAPQQVATLRAPGVVDLCFSRDGTLLASSGDDKTVRLWDVARRREVNRFSGYAMGRSVAFSPDGKSVAADGPDGSIRLWSVTARADTTTVLRPSSGTRVLAFSPDGRLLAMGARDGSVTLADARSGRTLATLKGHTARIVALAFSRDGTLLATGSDDHTARLWSLASRRVLDSFPGFVSGSWSGPRGVGFSPDGRTLAMQARDGVRLLDLRTKRTVATFPRRYLSDEDHGWGFAFIGENLLAAPDRLGNVILWDTTRTRAADSFSGHDVVAVSSDGKALAVNDYLRIPRLIDVASKRVVASLSGHTSGWGSLSFSPDGKTVATLGVQANDIMLWSRTTDYQVATLRGHTSTLLDVAFSPDSNTLASASADGTVRLWRAASFEQTDPAMSVVAGGGNGTVLLQWRHVPSAAGYHVYRRAPGAPAAPWTKLGPGLVQEASYLDQGPGLVNGRAQSYAVAALFPRAGEQSATEGPRVTCEATPVAAPPGFTGYSINEGPRTGSARFDAATGITHLRGSGSDIWNRSDQFYYLCRPVVGDFQITAKALMRPTHTNRWARAGLMIRETLGPSSRNACLAITPALKGLAFQWRPTTNDECDVQRVLFSEELRIPITLRLTRRGDTIAAEYSQDGQHFHPAGQPWTFGPSLPATLNAGLATTSHDINRTTESKFSDLQIRQR